MAWSDVQIMGQRDWKRYGALAVLARNLRKLGAELKARQAEKRKRHRQPPAA